MLIVDVASGSVGSLRVVMGGYAWSEDGRLAFVRGGGRLSWGERELFVLEQTGDESQVVARDDVVALHPEWDPVRGRLAWISGPKTDDFSGERYIDGTGAADRVVVIADASESVRFVARKVAEPRACAGPGTARACCFCVGSSAATNDPSSYGCTVSATARAFR